MRAFQHPTLTFFKDESTHLSSCKFPFGFHLHSSYCCPSGWCSRWRRSHPSWDSRPLISLLQLSLPAYSEEWPWHPSISNFLNLLIFWGMRWLAPCPVPKLEDQGFSVRADLHQLLLRRRKLDFRHCHSSTWGSTVAEVWHMTCSVVEPVWDCRHFFALLRATWWQQ